MELLCRLCGDPKSQDQIKCTIRDETLQIERKLIDCCRWNLYQDSENLPENVCQSCFECLQRSWEFLETVATVQQILNEQLNNLGMSIIKLERPVNGNIDGDMKVEIVEGYGSINEVLTTHFDNWSKADSAEDKTDFQIKMAPSTEASFPEINDDSRSDIEEKSISADGLKSIKPYEDETLENYTKYKINFLDNLTLDDRNPDGTVNEEAILRLKLANWSIFQHECNECNLLFVDAPALMRHHKKEHSDLTFRYKCWLCKDSTETHNYTERRSLIKHLIRHHIPYLAYCCKSCNKYYWDLKLLKKHRPNRANCIVRETVKLTIICEQCGDVFSSESNLRQHQYLRHTPIELRSVYECYACRKSFHSINGLKFHMEKHIKPKTIECSICQKKFYRNSYLSRHFKTHLDIMPYSCSFCGKRFKFVNRVATHERIHTGERPFKCRVENCDYRCTDSANIYKHMKQKHKMVFNK